MSDMPTTIEVKDHVIRVTAALYRVTDLFEDEEPLKWMLRKYALEVFELITQEDDQLPFKTRIRNIEGVLSRLRLMQDALSLAEAGNFVSRINFEVLGREYQILATGMENLKIPLVNSGEKELLPVPKAPKVSQQPREPRVQNRSLEVTGGVERRNQILKILEEKNWLGVSEITHALGASISEKTIQRDLFELIAEGVVKKEGEKRWTRYTRVNSL
jgi:predicted ArsR family transcriptional regulator